MSDAPTGGRAQRSTADPIDLPQPIAEIVDVLAGMPGAVAIVLGGSRGLGRCDATSDWDLGVYYRGAIDLTTLAAVGEVHPPGSWGRVMNGGAWLRCGNQKVDVLLRDLDVVQHWTERAARGEYDVDALLGYLAGVPTYSLCAELASCRLLRGALREAPPFPSQLAVAAPPRWRFHRSFSLDYARMHAARGDVAATIGQAAKAVIEEGHAILCQRGQWVLNEKRLIDRAGLERLQALFTHVANTPAELAGWVDRVARELGASAPAGDPFSPGRLTGGRGDS